MRTLAIVVIRFVGLAFRKRQTEEEQKETEIAKKQKEWNEKWEVCESIVKSARNPPSITQLLL